MTSRIARCVRFAEDVDGVARLQVAPGEDSIGVNREVADRDRADAVESPDRDALHRASTPRRPGGRCIEALCREICFTAQSPIPGGSGFATFSSSPALEHIA